MFRLFPLLLMGWLALFAGVPAPAEIALPSLAAGDSFSAEARGRGGGIQVLNLRSGTTLSYPVAFLSGSANAPDGASLTVRNRSTSGEESEFHTTVLGGRFKALIELVPGPNHLELSAGAARTVLTLRYRPASSPYVVRFIYFTDNSGDTEYQSELADDPQNFREKLSTAAKLMQTFTAERLYEMGYGRRTFNLELDAEGEVQVHVLAGPHSGDYYRSLSGLNLFYSIYGTVNSQLPSPIARNVVLPAFTRFDPVSRQLRGHAALGGGNLALFGSHGLFTWPDRIGEAQSAFLDPTPVDLTRTGDDAVGRSTYWALASTTMGATLHELGHPLDLPHSPDPWDIMSRGFDHLNRFFTLWEPPHAYAPQPYVFSPGEEARWGPTHAPRLAYRRWLEPEDQEYRDFPAPTVRLDPTTDRIRIEAAYGIRMVGLDAEGLSRNSLAFPKRAPRQLEYSRAELASRTGFSEFGIRVIDNEGNHIYVELSQLEDARRFVRDWRFATAPEPWPSWNAFLPVSPQQMADLTRRLSRRPLEEGGLAYVNLLPRYVPPTDSQVTYAYRTLRVEEDLPVQLLTGSDDALRVWINGVLVVSRLVQRGASPDQEVTSTVLRKGVNHVLVEVSNGVGDWGFYFRLTDLLGHPLVVSRSGAVLPFPSVRREPDRQPLPAQRDPYPECRWREIARSAE